MIPHPFCSSLSTSFLIFRLVYSPSNFVPSALLLIYFASSGRALPAGVFAFYHLSYGCTLKRQLELCIFSPSQISTNTIQKMVFCDHYNFELIKKMVEFYTFSLGNCTVCHKSQDYFKLCSESFFRSSNSLLLLELRKILK